MTLIHIILFPGMLNVTPLEFEKDDDSNGHIDYITAASVSKPQITKGEGGGGLREFIRGSILMEMSY